MIGRRQLAVASPVSGSALARALVASLLGGEQTQTKVRSFASEQIAETFGARGVVLTDSGTSALVLALRLAVPPGGTIGLPAYACVDLVAASLYAGVRVRLYDIDPNTLSPDLDSVRALVTRGVDAIVVAHLFGYGADVAAVQAIASPAGVTVIEDAAQGAGGTLDGCRLGAIGEFAILSFGRGKGLCAGGGGALLANSDGALDRVHTIAQSTPSRGLRGVATTAVQWLLGRPSLYAVPASIPWLHLGEMVFHAAHEPKPMSRASVSLVPSAFALEPDDLAHRRETARRLDELVGGRAVRNLASIERLPRSFPGYLRYPVRDLSGQRSVAPEHGVVRPYPTTLAEAPQVRPTLVEGEPPTPGAADLARFLFTLPTHRFVTAQDTAALATWVRQSDEPVW